ncbi:sensor histidine kinase [Aureimonas populi]|uniref:histidine kinase n=1 Tax=Aureimonas populi TaxID=1701758 RepID=A0ABW5CJ56_9HYPH|nr:histidine kinase dimerization/phosphoacceptor domain -containing protein [Aureimonas populi]
MFAAAEYIRHRALLAWGLSLAAFLVAVAVRFLVDHQLPPGFPYLTFFPAVILTAFFGGLWPGLACALASGLAAWYWFIPPVETFAVDSAVTIALAFYACIVAVDILLIHVMHRAVERLAAERGVTRALYDQQRVMFQELQHRVANNMQFVSSLLGLQKRRVAADPASAAAAFDEARARLDTIGRVHRRLYDPDTVDQPFDGYLQALCEDVLSAAGQGAVTCRVEACGLRFDLRTLTSLSLIVVEGLTNALKHAFPGREGGHIRITLRPLAQGRFQLDIADDGVGFDPQAGVSSASLGQRIVRSLAAQLGGSILYLNEGGTTMRLEFEAAHAA